MGGAKIVSDDELTHVVAKNKGNQQKSAIELNISRQAISKRLKGNPNLKKKILTLREKAMSQAGITRSRVYRRIKEGIDAKIVYLDDNGTPKQSKIPDRKERREYSKICLDLFRDLEPEYNPEKEKPSIEPHLHLHFEKVDPEDLTNLLLGRLSGPIQSHS